MHDIKQSDHENAEEFKASQLAGPREKTGSTDFGNVMYDVPGCCIRTAFSRREPQHIPRNIWKPEKQRKHMRHFGTEQKFLPEPVWIFWNGLNFFQKSKRNSGNGSRRKRTYPFKNK